MRGRSRAVWIAGLVLPVLAWGQVVPSGSDFQVNSYTTFGQFLPAVSRHSDGSFVAVWQNFFSGTGNDTSSGSVNARRFASDGTPSGGEFQVNTFTSNAQGSPDVSPGADGSFFVVWQSTGSSGSDGSGTSIQSRLFGSDGTPIGADMQVNTFSADNQSTPAVGRNSEGEFAVVWRSTGSSGSDLDGTSIQGQLFDSAGAMLAAEFQVNTYTTGDQHASDVSGGPGGRFIVVWSGSGGDANFSSVHGQLFSGLSTPLGSQFQVNAYTTGNQEAPAVSVSPDGSFVVVWRSYPSPGADTEYGSIQARRFGSDGLPLGAQFSVNTYTTQDQQDPDVSHQADGSFVVVWHTYEDKRGAFDAEGVRGQLYAPNGSPSGGEFQVNTYTTGQQIRAVVSVGVGGGVAVWQSEGSAGTDTSVDSIQARLFAPEPTSTATPTPPVEPTSTATPTATPTPPATPALGGPMGLSALVVLLLAGLCLAAARWKRGPFAQKR